MATDALLSLQPQVTKAATFQGAGMPLLGGTPPRGLFARIIYVNATSTTTNTATWSIETSPDNGVTWFARTSGAEKVVNLTPTPQVGEFWLPIETADTMIRLVLTIAGAGVASVTYKGDIDLVPPTV